MEKKKFIKMHGVTSDILLTISSILQGGHLILCFFIFLNSINLISKHVWLLIFTDNVTVFYRIHCLVLRDELNKILLLAKTLELGSNVSKCHFMTFTHLKFQVKVYMKLI